jgi:hypothetical protein
MARLGADRECEALLPANSYASLAQVIQPPSVECDLPLRLSYRYRIKTYDVAWGKTFPDGFPDGILDWIDPFELFIRDINGNELARFVPAGNRTNYNDWDFCDNPAQSFYDSGWRTDSIDLSPWANQRIWIDFRVRNGLDPYWPTWVYVDEVKLSPAAGHSVSVPLALRSASPQRGSQLEMGPTPMPRPPSATGRPSRK